MAKVGLVLEGGGMRGLYTSGVLDVMIEKGFMPDVICGTSAGVTFGVNLPSGQKGRVLRYNTSQAGNPQYISFRSLLRTGNMINVDFAYDTLPHVLDPFDNDAFKASGVEFYATVTNVETGEAEYMLVDDCDARMDVIRASASLPFLSKKVYLNGVPYLDGGIVDNIPLEKCLELGCDRIIVVLTHPRGYVRTGNMRPAGNIFYHKDKNLLHAFDVRSRRYNECMSRILEMEQAGKLFAIFPSGELTVSRLESDPEKMRQAHRLGVDDATAAWAGLEKYLLEV